MNTIVDTQVKNTVLLVEGEVLIRMPIAAYLRECGYQVIEAANVDEAMIVLQTQGIRVDVVFADTEMTGPTDGFGLAQWVRENRPEIKTVLAGTPKRAAAIAGNLCEDGPLLSKPYHPAAVEDHIRRLLAARVR